MKELRSRCWHAYEHGGQYAVYELFSEDDTWLRCEPCDDVTPDIEGECAVCGTYRNVPHKSNRT